MKGVNLSVMALVVAAVILIGILWYQAKPIGTEQTKELRESFTSQRTANEFQNSVIYLEESLRDNVANDSKTIAMSAGRNGTEERYRYWRCDPGGVEDSDREKLEQIPSVERVKLSFINFTGKSFANRIRELHGVRDNVVYDVGDIKCVEVGHNTPLDHPANDRFKAGILLSYLDITFGNYKSGGKDISFTNEINYNRFWYLYKVLAKWAHFITNKSVLQQNVEQEMAKVPDYIDDVFCGQCPCPYRSGCAVIPMMWRELLPNAVHKGVKKTVDLLEEPEYFDDNQVMCTYSFGRQYYDNHPHIKNSIIGICGCSNFIALDGGGRCANTIPLWHCRLEYTYHTEIDINVSCTDMRYTSIPREELERQKWVITLNLEAEDPPNEGEFPPPCDTVKGQPCDWEKRPPVCRITNPKTQCDFDESPSRIGDDRDFPDCVIKEKPFLLCDSKIETEGNLTQKEMDDYERFKFAR